jgi:hypothetical protein
MLTVSRRGLLVLGGTGAAGVALAACGQAADPRADASQGDLLQAELDAEVALAAAYKLAATTLRPGAERTALEDFAAAADKRAEQLRGLAPDANAGSQTPPPDGGPDSAEAVAATARLANSAIAAHNQAAGLLNSVETRALASSALAACAAELAAVNHFSGKPEVPHSFVTGGEQPPYESSTAETTSTTSSSTSTSTTAESTVTTTETTTP